MSGALFALSCVFWGVVIISVLVFAHELGHYLAARACGVRVTELFLGMPCRLSASFVLPARGTRVGVTPLLLGGYTRICGMANEPAVPVEGVLACVMRHGRVRVADLAEEVSCTEDEAYSALATLIDWASVEPVYDPSLGENAEQSNWPSTFGTVDRDSSLHTRYDSGHDFSSAGATAAGDPRPVEDVHALYEGERSRTYCGKGFLSRAVMLLGGPVASLVTGVALLLVALSVVGLPTPIDSNELGTVEAGSPAELAGLRAGDRVLSADGTSVSSFTELAEAIRSCDDSTLDIVYERDGQRGETTALLSDEGTLGVSAPLQTQRMPVSSSLRYTAIYCGQVLAFIAQLATPSQTMQAVGESSSVVGMSVMAGQAATTGAGNLILIAACISLSLAFMNMLPVPPLDGGKILIECAQALLHREFSTRLKTALSLVGTALFLLLFIVVVRQDIVRLLAG